MQPAGIIALSGLWILFLLLSFITLGYLRRIGPILERVERDLQANVQDGLQPGVLLPSFSGRDIAGEVVTQEDLSLPALLLFSEPGCPPCEVLRSEFVKSGWQAPIACYLVTQDSDDGREFAQSTGLIAIYQREEAVSAAFRSFFYPRAYLVGVDGRILEKGAPNHLSELESMAAFRRKEVEARSRQMSISDDPTNSEGENDRFDDYPTRVHTANG